MESLSDGSRVIATGEAEVSNIVDTDSEEHVISNTDAADNSISPCSNADPCAVVLDGGAEDPFSGCHWEEDWKNRLVTEGDKLVVKFTEDDNVHNKNVSQWYSGVVTKVLEHINQVKVMYDIEGVPTTFSEDLGFFTSETYASKWGFAEYPETICDGRRKRRRAVYDA